VGERVLTNEDKAEIKRIIQREIVPEVIQDLVHELRQPLSSIEAIAYYLEMVLPAEQNQAREYMRRLQQLVDQSNALLHAATIEANYANPQLIPTAELTVYPGGKASTGRSELSKRAAELLILPVLKPPLDVFMRITARAVEVLGSQEKAFRWLKTPVRSLSNQQPLSLLNSPEGTAQVEDALGRVQHGVW
jgi:signal transduction histidine kinase